MLTPVDSRSTFFVLMCLTAVFMPFSSPNVVATIFDVTPPEVRSTVQSVEYFIESSGAALAPTLAGAIALATNKQTAILSVCVTAWVLCFFLYLGALFFISADAQDLRDQMRKRADQERLLHATE
jgi:fucose permease